jgi:hypothetical protein
VKFAEYFQHSSVEVEPISWSSHTSIKYILISFSVVQRKQSFGKKKNKFKIQKLKRNELAE